MGGRAGQGGICRENPHPFSNKALKLGVLLTMGHFLEISRMFLHTVFSVKPRISMGGGFILHQEYRFAGISVGFPDPAGPEGCANNLR